MDARQRAPGADLRAVAIAFTAGVLFVHALPSLLSPYWYAALLPPALWPWRGRALLLAALLGALLTGWHAQRQLDARWPDARYNEERWVRGTIASLPERADEPAGEDGAPRRTWRFTFVPEPGADLPSRIRVSWYRTDAVPAGGQCWRLKLRLRAPHGSLNPGGFDYEAWLFRQHLGATATVREAESCAAAGAWPVLRLRQAWSDRVDATLGARRGAALLKALTIGATAELGDADWDAFRLTGTTHLIAISGFNLALVSGFAYFVLRWAWSLSAWLCLRLPAQRAALFGSAGVATVYALLAGFEPPVARALFMLLVLVAAAALYRFTQPSRALALAWLAIVAADPCAVLAPGLWLSFAAVGAIFYLVVGRWRPQPAWRAAVRVQLFLSFVLAPLTLFYFHGLAWAAPFVNLLAVPLFALLTPALLLVALAASLSPALAGAWLPPTATLLEWVLAALQALAAHWPLAWLPSAPPLAALALALLGSLLLFAPAGLPLRPLGALCLLPLLWPPQQPVRGGLELHVLDVGQGLSVLVRTARHSLLFDAGPAYEDGFDAGAAVVAPYVLTRGLRGVDLLVLSHGDRDHAGGVPALRRLLRPMREIGTERGEPCRDGERWEWDGVRFALLHPPAAAGADDARTDNDRSCVLKIDGPFSLLLPGDIERRAEARLLDAHPAALRADVLLAPHHGSRSSSSPVFVAAVGAREVIFASGWHNRFGHPRAEVVRRYLDCGARLSMSGEAGAITIFRAGDTLRVERWRERAAHYWNAPPVAQPYWRAAGEALPAQPCGG